MANSPNDMRLQGIKSHQYSYHDYQQARLIEGSHDSLQALLIEGAIH